MTPPRPPPPWPPCRRAGPPSPPILAPSALPSRSAGSGSGRTESGGGGELAFSIWDCRFGIWDLGFGIWQFLGYTSRTPCTFFRESHLTESAPGEFMQQRRVRLGDILDDYCPRERRITNHVVVAMIEEAVKQTRCTTCDADHEYKEAKVPAARRRKAGALATEDLDAGARPRPATVDAEETVSIEEPRDGTETFDEPQPIEAAAPADVAAVADGDADPESPVEDGDRDEWPVHRPLIRATLPRPEGQAPERKATDFTVRPAGSGGRFDAQRNNGQRNRGHRPMRQGQGQGQPSGPPRFG